MSNGVCRQWDSLTVCEAPRKSQLSVTKPGCKLVAPLPWLIATQKIQVETIWQNVVRTGYGW